MLRSSQISMRSRLISTRSSRISMRPRRILKRSGHFLTNRTKTTGEMLPSMENEDFFRCNTVESVFFRFSCLDPSTNPPVSGIGGDDPPPTRHQRLVGRFSNWPSWLGGSVGGLVWTPLLPNKAPIITLHEKLGKKKKKEGIFLLKPN